MWMSPDKKTHCHGHIWTWYPNGLRSSFRGLYRGSVTDCSFFVGSWWDRGRSVVALWSSSNQQYRKPMRGKLWNPHIIIWNRNYRVWDEPSREKSHPQLQWKIITVITYADIYKMIVNDCSSQNAAFKGAIKLTIDVYFTRWYWNEFWRSLIQIKRIQDDD